MDQFYKETYPVWCKKCKAEYSIEHYRRNIKEKRAYARKYYREHKERIAESRKESFAPGKASRRWIKKTYAEDQIYRLAHLIRDRTSKAVRRYLGDGYIFSNTKYKKGEVGYIPFEHIIKKLGKPPGEIGRGKGKWTIDHIIPLRWLDLTDPIEYAIAAHQDNVRWLPWEENYQRQFDGLGEEETQLYFEIRNKVLGVNS